MSGADFICYLARTKHGARLVYFEPQNALAKSYLALRTGAAHLADGIWLSCARAAATDSTGRGDIYREECYASLLARMLVEHNEFRVQLSNGAPPNEPAPDAPGFGFRLDGDMAKRLFIQPKIPAPAGKKKANK